MTEIEIKRICQILARLAIQVQEIKENGKISTQQTQETNRADRPMEARSVTSTGCASHIRKAVNKESSSKEYSIQRDAN